MSKSELKKFDDSIWDIGLIYNYNIDRIQHMLDKYSVIGNFNTPTYNGAPAIINPTKMVVIRTTDQKKLFKPFISKYSIPICVCQVHDPYEIKMTIYNDNTERLITLLHWLMVNWVGNIIDHEYFSFLDIPNSTIASIRLKVLEGDLKDSNKFWYDKDDSLNNYKK